MRTVVLILGLAILGGAGFWWLQDKGSQSPAIQRTQQLREDGSTGEDGPSFMTSPTVEVSDATEVVIDQQVLIAQPSPERGLTSPVRIEGQAVGTWFNEGQFSIELRTDADEVIGTAQAEAEGEWMTEEMVPFSATLAYDNFAVNPGETEGKLIFEKANPSGLPANDESVSMSVYFE